LVTKKVEGDAADALARKALEFPAVSAGDIGWASRIGEMSFGTTSPDSRFPCAGVGDSGEVVEPHPAMSNMPPSIRVYRMTGPC